MSTDQQALEMASYSMSEFLRWERKHHIRPDAHATPLENCPICRWGCQIAGCNCTSSRSVNP